MPSLADRVRETTDTTGTTAAVVLNGAIDASYQTFVEGYGDGGEAFYLMTNPATKDWELGYATVSDNGAGADTLTRVAGQVINGTAGPGFLTDFGAGPSDVWGDLPGREVFLRDGSVPMIGDLEFDIAGLADVGNNSGPISLSSDGMLALYAYDFLTNFPQYMFFPGPSGMRWLLNGTGEGLHDWDIVGRVTTILNNGGAAFKLDATPGQVELRSYGDLRGIVACVEEGATPAPPATPGLIKIYSNVPGELRAKFGSTGDVKVLSGLESREGRELIDGLTMIASNLGPPFVTVTPGITVLHDGNNYRTAELTSAFQKRIDAPWGEGPGLGALDTGTAQASTWYHIHKIVRPDNGNIDWLASLSATNPTMPTNYTYSRRIGAIFLTGTLTLLRFEQNGDWFYWSSEPIGIYDMNVSTGWVESTIHTPKDVKVKVIGKTRVTATTVKNACIQIRDPDEPAYTPIYGDNMASDTETFNDSQVSYFTGGDTKNKLAYRCTVTPSQFVWSTRGWLDPRGRKWRD